MNMKNWPFLGREHYALEGDKCTVELLNCLQSQMLAQPYTAAKQVRHKNKHKVANIRMGGYRTYVRYI